MIDEDTKIHFKVGGGRAGPTAALVVLALLCAAAAALVLLYILRKRVHNLKREFQHVHCTANPGSQPDGKKKGYQLRAVAEERFVRQRRKPQAESVGLLSTHEPALDER